MTTSTTMPYEIIIEHPEGRIERVVVEGGHALVGSGAHCDACLPPGSAAVEQLDVHGDTTSVFVAVRASVPPVTRNGAPFTRGRVREGDVLEIGPNRLRFALIVDDAAAKSAGASSSGYLGVISFALSIPLLAYAVLSPRDDGARTPPQPEPLWPARAAACVERDPSVAGALARDRFAHALAKRERMPFSIRDGVASATLLEEAVACFHVAGNTGDERAAAEALATLRAHVEAEYRGHHLRLEHALSVDEAETALREARILQAMVRGDASPYARWLQGVVRVLENRRAAVKP